MTNPGANLDPFIELLDENLVVLAADGEFFTSIGQLQNDGTIGSLSATITLPLASGRYFLRVGGQRSATLLEYGNIGTYSITIEGVDGTDVSLSFLPNPNTGDVAISENEGTVVGIGRVDRPRGQPITSDLIIELESTDTS